MKTTDKLPRVLIAHYSSGITVLKEERRNHDTPVHTSKNYTYQAQFSLHTHQEPLYTVLKTKSKPSRTCGTHVLCRFFTLPRCCLQHSCQQDKIQLSQAGIQGPLWHLAAAYTHSTSLRSIFSQPSAIPNLSDKAQPVASGLNFL